MTMTGNGNQHVDGKLRTFQLCWAPGQAACIRFMDDQLNYVFDVSYREAGAILSKWVDRPEVKYIGHHISVDLTWMHYWLGTKWYRKAIFDSEFATQLCDESLDLGLDAVALRYTSFGKYDLDLIRWKKKNSDKCKEGYGYIPDDILLDYSMKDVDSCMRAWPHLTRWMEKQGLTRYYNEICNPFVTDVFTFWCLKGIPIDRKKMNEVRELYNWAKEELNKDFLTSMVQDAKGVLKKRLEDAGSDRAADVIEALDDLLYRGQRQAADAIAASQGKSGRRGKTGASIDKETGLPTETLAAANDLIKNEVGAASWMDVKPALEHYITAPKFNIRSKKHMQRWLFDVKQYTPVKSTANKAEGIPSVDWNKVLTYPPDKQRLFTPASDIGTLEILASRYKDPVIEQLLELNKVGNISKSFLPAAEIDKDTGEPIGEKGIAYWLASDDKIHLNHSTTKFLVLRWVTGVAKKVNSGEA